MLRPWPGRRMGVAAGTSKTTFNPNDFVTRQEAACFLHRYLTVYLGEEPGAGAKLSAFSDSGEIASWAKEAMAWSVAADIFSGYDNHTLAPRKDLNRAELAKILTDFDINF